MAKRKTVGFMAQRIKLEAAPTLVTQVRSADWAGGVLFLEVESGKERATLAFGPSVVIDAFGILNRAMKDNAAPFSQRRPSVQQTGAAQ